MNIFTKIQNSSLFSYLKGKTAKKQTTPQKTKEESAPEKQEKQNDPKRDHSLDNFLGGKKRLSPGSKAHRRKIKAIAYESKRYNWSHCN
jgi:hypothetical protein